MTGREIAASARERLRAAGIEDARFEAEYLVRNLGQLSRSAYFAGASPPDERLDTIESGVARRVLREPAAYVTGEREFRGLVFSVGPAVLVPRPETEMLVEIATEGAAILGPRAVIVDVGTGSGAVAVSLAVELPLARVVATDVSPAALAFARLNRDRYEARLSLLRGDLLSAVRHANIVLANLPYIPTGEIDALEPEVSRWEPRVALDGGHDGFVLIRRLVEDCAERLRPALLALEVGFGQAAAVRKICMTAGARVETRVDLAGIERIVLARW